MIDVLVPFEQEGTKAIVRNWLRKIGDTVALNDPLVELETDKVTQEVSAPASGILAEIVLDSDAEATPGAILGRIRSSASAIEAAPEQIESAAEPATFGRVASGATELPVRNLALSPAVRRAVKEHGIDPARVAGTGRNGRITRADIDQAVGSREISLGRGTSTVSALSATAARNVPHDRMRLAIAENMLNSVTAAPHVTAVFEADFTAIIAHRKKHKSAYEKNGASLSFTAYIVAACVAAMRVSPAINSRWHADRLEIFDDVNIGVGTALGEKGLVVPVISHAQTLSLLGIAARLTEQIGKARDGKLVPADVRGGTFTISNHGVSGSLFATPIIIAQPQSAILGVGKLEKRVVVREVDGIDTIQIRPMCFVSLTIDHRVVDGHQTNLWLSKFVETLEGWPLNG
jgi:2-oxoglutarate dehydrogenase E2 component (dihydrolipoamide succinyltransferase)